MMTTIPVPLTEAELAKVDYLVKSGRYKNRTQAIVAILSAGIQAQVIPFEWERPDEREASAKLLEKMLNTPDLNFSIQSEKSAHELLGDERER